MAIVIWSLAFHFVKISTKCMMLCWMVKCIFSIQTLTVILYQLRPNCCLFSFSVVNVYTGDSLYLKVQGTRQNTSELSVVWDSQFVTSFTLYMYTDCFDHSDYNLHVHVFGNDILEFKYPLTELLISHTNFEKAATEMKEYWWLLTSKKVVKQCSITKVTKAPLRTLWV